jgi:hypothetical protein
MTTVTIGRPPVLNAPARLAVAIFVVAGATFISGVQTAAAPVTINVDATAVAGTFQAQLGTQFHWPGSLDQSLGARPLFRALGEPLIRILASNDGCCWPGGPPPMMPAGKVKGSWNFSSLDSVVNDIDRAGAQPVLTIASAPDWMWNCGTGAITDPTFNDFGAYMARLVAYYNRGSFIAEDGSTITNPAGISNRITYWEIWNEPNLWALSCLPAGNPNITVAQYVTMWNAAAAKMLAVDPTILLVGPTTAGASTGRDPDYLPALMVAANHKPDVVSYHGYGGWLNSQTDQFLFGDGCCGLDSIASGLTQVRAWAPGIPVWITELNVNASWETDPTHRAYNAFGAAWGASAFRRLALGGANAIFQYQFANPGNPSLSMIDISSGQPLLPYWRDYYLARYFPRGSSLLSASSSLAGVETLAAQAPGSNNVHVLVVNRQVDGPAAVGGSGLPATVQVSIGNLSGVTQVLLRQFDDATPLASGPPAMVLPTGNNATLSFAGYGAAILDFVTNSPPVSSPPPPPPPPPPPLPPSSLVFADGFESGDLTAWTATAGTGSAATENTVVHAGTYALSLSTATGQGVWLMKDLGQPLPSSSTSFYVRPTSATAGFVAWGRDATSAKARWGLYYDPTGHSFAYLVYDDAGTATELDSGAGTVPLDTWTKVELRYIGTTNGGAELLVNGVSKASVSGKNYSSASPYQRLQLANETAASTTYFDDVVVR